MDEDGVIEAGGQVPAEAADPVEPCCAMGASGGVCEHTELRLDREWADLLAADPSDARALDALEAAIDDPDGLMEPVLRSGLGVPIEVLADMAPGPDVATALAGVDLAEVDAYDLVEVVAAAQRVQSWAASVAARAAHALYRSPQLDPSLTAAAVDPTLNPAAEVVAMRTGTTRAEARDLIGLGRGSSTTLSDTGEALAAGLIDTRRARLIINRLTPYPDEIAWAAEQQVLPQAQWRNYNQLARDLDKALAGADPEETARRHKVAANRRRVTRPRRQPDGMASMQVYGPATDLVEIDLVLDAVATAAKAEGDTRTTDQLRADTLVTLAGAALATGRTGELPELPEADGCPCAHAHDGPAAADAAGDAAPPDAEPQPPPGMRPGVPWPDQHPGTPTEPAYDPAAPSPYFPNGYATKLGKLLALVVHVRRRTPMRLAGTRTKVHVTVPLSVLVGALPPAVPPAGGPGDAGGQEPGDVPEPVETATLHGYGPIPDETARALAAGGTWQRLVTDPLTGTVLDVGRSRYTPPTGLAEHVRHRDVTCVRPGCSTPADRCQLDHTEPWSQGGTTSSRNLGAQCVRDHALKTAGMLKVTQPEPGVFDWITPTGHAFRRTIDGTTAPLPRWNGKRDDEDPDF